MTEVIIDTIGDRNTPLIIPTATRGIRIACIRQECRRTA